MFLTQSPVAQRAVAWCLFAGGVAVALGVAQLKSSTLARWSASFVLSFWQMAGLAALDAVLVVAASRGSRSFRWLTRIVLGTVFAAALMYLVVGWMAIGMVSRADLSWSEFLFYEALLALIAIVQWMSLKAVAENSEARPAA